MELAERVFTGYGRQVKNLYEAAGEEEGSTYVSRAVYNVRGLLAHSFDSG